MTGCQKMDQNIVLDKSTMTIRGDLVTLSSWHCLVECQSTEKCDAYTWHAISEF